jgi:hypothetical protein
MREGSELFFGIIFPLILGETYRIYKVQNFKKVFGLETLDHSSIQFTFNNEATVEISTVE